jgi:hypothetical protein
VSEDLQILNIQIAKRAGGSASLPLQFGLLHFLSWWFFFFCVSSLQAQRNRSLTEQSPFIPPGFQEQIKKEQEQKAIPPPPAPKPPPLIEKNLEFKGCMRLRSVWRFSIFDKRSSKSTWVRLNEKSEAGFTITEFDEENKTIIPSRVPVVTLCRLLT